MRRREFIAGLGGVVVLPVAARAQHCDAGDWASRPYLGRGRCLPPDPFRKGLSEESSAICYRDAVPSFHL
jgi:hypothetical protein